MRNLLFILAFVISDLCFAQTKDEFNKLISEISIDNSIYINISPVSKRIISYNEKSLPILSELFTDESLTNVKSDCLERNLTKGEIAIIIADKIKQIPYARVIGVQNCLLEFCKNNPNLIEYYLPYIKRDNAKSFTERYNLWLNNKRK